MYKVLQDEKPWIALVNVVLSLLLYFGGKYEMPSHFEDAKFLIGVLQPFVAALFGAIWHAENLLATKGRLPHFIKGAA